MKYIALAALMAADVVTTLHFTSQGATELNPIGRWLLEWGPVGLLAGKAVVYTCFVLAVRAAGDPAGIWRAALLISSAPVVWNMVVILVAGA